ncbi:MAG: hypothetical protein A2Y67_03740 [Candidatus Buchananbacteria bacterium RBG_13_39_9]|uniref:Four helix bundle protein n=1 Tax=Candidatus Buchananbacteria bacterium RBG_13_39_9 TaxID=1797531 RepID=A0A1G1XRV6_9BACT|nr:MAG: hypothetical protein A2Y67_03740 [Candidatus Buchananbacteria bacterium RBG_13_39_9]
MQKSKDILENFSEKFPILERSYQLYQKIGEIAKNEDNTLRKSSEITVLEILELIVIATRQGKNDKFQTLRQAVRKIDTLKVFADMAKEVKQISDSKYGEIRENLDNLGKMLGGWLKAINPANAPAAPTAK